MSESVAKCPKCDNAAPLCAAFCPSCGAALHAKPARAIPRAVALPPRGELQGPCTLIYAGAAEMDVRRVGRLIAEAVSRPLPDVTRELRSSKGFLASAVDAAKAGPLADRMEKELDAPVLVIPDTAVVAMPPALRMRHATIGPDGVRCEAYSWDSSEPVHVGWTEVFLISCARMEVQEAVEPRDEAEGGSLRLGFRGAPNLVMKTRHEYMLDIVLFEPWRRLRLDQNTVAFSLTEMKHTASDHLGPLYRCAINLDRLARSVPMNRGVSLLAGGGTETAWESLTFLNKRDFDSYTHWLLQLVRYGRPIEA